MPKKRFGQRAFVRADDRAGADVVSRKPAVVNFQDLLDV
jgi:hypothetical protein